MNRPNLVIIMTDQQRADLRKGEGYPLDTMPFVDSLGASGVDFASAYTPNPSCLPARVSMMTGRYTQCHRARTNHNGVDAYYTEDLLDVVKKAGYRTALCGKNHSQHPDSDFDYANTNGHWGNHQPFEETEASRAVSEFLEVNRMDSLTPAPGGVEGQHPYQNVSAALRFVEEQGENPFFLWLSFAEPHNPYQVPEPYFSLFPPENLPPVSSLADGTEKSPRLHWLGEVWQGMFGEEIEERIARNRSCYLGMLRLIDDQIRRFVTGLEERGLMENTLLLFVSDHGDFAGEYGIMRKGPDLPEVLTRIPMIWTGAGIHPQGRRTGCFASLVDVLPTICDLLGVETPFGCQGKSLLPILQGKDFPQEEYETAYAESGFGGLYWNQDDGLDLQTEGAWKPGHGLDCLNTWTQSGQVRMLRMGDYKLQLDMLGKGYLYYLPDDPVELHNLYDDPAYEPVKLRMLERLAAVMMQNTDPLPSPRSRYRVKIHPKGYWYQPFTTKDSGVRQLPPVSKLPPIGKEER